MAHSIPATATIRCRRCKLSGTVQVTGRGTVATLGQVHSATQHGGRIRQAQANPGAAAGGSR